MTAGSPLAGSPADPEGSLIGILYHPRVAEAQALSTELAAALRARGYRLWAAPAWHEGETLGLMSETSTVICLGGDGTIMRAARALLPNTAPILGVRFGRLGFIAELSPEIALERVPELLAAPEHIESRTMLQATLTAAEIDPALRAIQHPLLRGDLRSFHALNEIIVARGAAGRPILVQVVIDGQLLTTYRADGVTVATPTGSTGYVLSAGGPLLHPTSRCFVLTPVAPHATLHNALVLEPRSVVELTIYSDHGASVSIDGQADIIIQDGETVTIRRSPYEARFLRAAPNDHFYASLLHRLRFGESAQP